jgi:hypothetical protein
MTSTRSKNTPGNYSAEQWSITQQFENSLYQNAPNGQAHTRNLPGQGLLAGKMANRDLALNYCDIESDLYGIGSTNLVQPLAKVNPEILFIPSLNLYQKTPLQMPKDLFVEANQRPMPLN